MKIRQEYYDEDLLLKEEVNAKIDEGLRRRSTPGVEFKGSHIPKGGGVTITHGS